MRTGVVDMPRYDKYIVGKKHLRLADGEYVDRRRYKDSIYFKSINKVVMHIDIPLIQLINQGVNITTFRTLLVKQFNPATQHIECPVCQANLNSQKVRKVIDHNHTTGKVRGILCHSCNTSLGMLKENPEIINQAIAYLSIDFSNNITYQSVRKRKQLVQVYGDLVKQRSETCRICGKNSQVNKRRLAIDHSHNEGNIRDLLCSNCNTSLGFIKENKQSLANMIKYLEQTNK